MTDIVEWLRKEAELIALDRLSEAADTIERLLALKTPASRQLLNITKGCLDNAEAECERLQAELDIERRRLAVSEEALRRALAAKDTTP